MASSARKTLQDIADTLGVPVDQVTKVILGQPGINEVTRRRIHSALEEARIVRVSRDAAARSIGIVVPGAVIGDYVGEVVQGASEAVRALGFSLILNIENASGEDDLVQMLDAGGCEGVIAVVPNHYDRLLELCQHYRRDYVLVDYQGDEDVGDALTVEVNNRQSLVELMNYLLEMGHQRIGFIAGGLTVASARQRLQGYYDALQAGGIPVDPALVREGNWFHDGGYQQGRALLELNAPPTAIVTCNDLMAFGAMQAAREHGLQIGDDISITGFDDISMASTVTPGLTTIRQPMSALGATAVELLVKRINGEPIANPHARLETELIIRESTGHA